MYSRHKLAIRFVGAHYIAALWELHEEGATLVALYIGIVFIGEVTPEHAEAEPLAPLKFFDERDAIENFSIEVPSKI